MILTCPSCTTRYLLPPAALLPSGREVRCAKCGHRWFQDPPVDLPRQPEVEAPPHASIIEPGSNLPGPPRRRNRAEAVSWIVLLLVLAAGVAGAVRWRDKIVAAWPQAGKLYDVLGLPVAASGLTLAEPQAERKSENGVDVLIVSGEIGLSTQKERPVPPVWVSLLDENNRVLRREVTASDPTTLRPGTTAKYRVRFAAPPAEAAKIAAGFGEQP